MLVIVVELILVRRCTVAKHDITRADCDHPIVEAYRGMPLLLHLQQVEVAESLRGIFEAACLGRKPQKCKVAEQRPGEFRCFGSYRRRLDVQITGQL